MAVNSSGCCVQYSLYNFRSLRKVYFSFQFILPRHEKDHLPYKHLFTPYTYEYSINETGAKRKAGQVKEERSPEKEAKDFKKELKAPFCSVGILSTLLTSSLSAEDIVYNLDQVRKKNLRSK